MPNELFHEFDFGQAYVFDRVCREKSVLHIQERSFGFLGSAPGNQSEITSLLCIPSEKSAPAAIGDAIHVVVPCMHIQRVRREGASAEKIGRASCRERV